MSHSTIKTLMMKFWLRNRTPTKCSRPRTPIEVGTGEKTDLSRAHQFGYTVCVGVKDGSKLQFVETADGHKVYWKSNTNKVTIKRNVHFKQGVPLPSELRKQGEQVEISEDHITSMPTPTKTDAQHDTAVSDSAPEVVRSGADHQPDIHSAEGEPVADTPDTRILHEVDFTATDIDPDDPTRRGTFSTLRHALGNDITFPLPREGVPFRMETNTSDYAAIRGVLHQQKLSIMEVNMLQVVLYYGVDLTIEIFRHENAAIE
ncbi:hypothetical protein EXIGLDRAFT_708878 [Exidia glandulosa HHB12029]|uniref:Uncharacterized protein n=1 Tax=Exidia glandulosa HHB12029 TaxID=1314781 RepID=A0A165J4Q8_EXIGL|nr:hypothetical protein EXIGLDRAFT_708878 [Exidia glandulosa HHB12029]